MTVLRQRMIDDLQLPGVAVRIQEAVVAEMEQLAKYSHRAPDQIGAEL